MPIEAVFFDIGNVLLRFDAVAVAAKLACLAAARPARAARYLWSHGASSFNDALERGTISSRELLRVFREDFGWRGDAKEFRRIWCDHFTLEAGTAELLTRLRRTHRVYLLSNTHELHYRFIRENFAFPRQVHGAVLSYKLGLRKPEPAIFRAALELARVEAQRAVFIDDLERNVAAARKLGINAFRYTGMDALRRDLAGVGLKA